MGYIPADRRDVANLRPAHHVTRLDQRRGFLVQQLAFDDLVVRHARADGDESVFLTDFIQPDDARHIDQRRHRMLVALLQVEDQIGAAGHYARLAVIAR